MTTKQHTVADRVKAAMRDAERPASWVATKAGMSPSTFRRKIQGSGEFTVSELAQVAHALNVAPSSLLPAEFRTNTHAKGAA
ncbi:helix-turn-helix domain-containing protein [Timonella senegalensis]|uniref:helix-turn-helix domain-containing protein n=1 Tax=Timonella senegalensis TaxID=1465825 RepID=UPI002FDCDD45